MRTTLATLVFSVLSLTPAAAQGPFEFWPGASYDPAIPTFRKVLGYDAGEQISTPEAILKYVEALAAASRQVRVFDYGKTWEGRRLVYAVVGSESNVRRLPEIRSAMQRLADPRKTPEPEARKLMASLPAVAWIGCGVHGNEISSSEAGLLLAYHLLASRNDKMAAEILANSLIIIDPLQNPDGRARFVQNFEQSSGIEPDASPLAAEHNEPWPGGRSNHYYFDMNRDWFALTQPETRGRVKAMLEWFPLVFADLHEMGSDSTYYFAPQAVPYNPHLTKEQRESVVWFGENNARWFDRFGYTYFTREVFDAFYPGYGDGWPAYFGSIAMTYEQASVRGLAMRRADDTTFYFRDSVKEHFVAALSTAETTARNREKLLSQFYRYRQTAIEEGRTGPVREYVLVRTGDTSAVDKLAANLVEQGAEVRRATAPFRAGGREYPAGSYAISLVQPAKRLIRNLLDLQVAMDEAFIKEQERRRRKKLPDEIYDVTAWSLPLLYGVEAVPVSEAVQGSFEPAAAVPVPPGRVVGSRATVAYLVPWGPAASARLLASALRTGLKVMSTDKAFTLGGRKYPSGTLVFMVKQNPAGLPEILGKLAASTGAEIYATDTSWVEDGINFGSRYVVAMRRPAVALAWDQPASSASAGATRYVLERQYGYPVTVVRCRQLASADLSRFHVIVFPDQGAGGGYAQALGPAGIRRLKDWVAAGGTVIGLGSAVSFLADSRVALLAVSQENLARSAEPAKKPETATQPKPAETASAARPTDEAAGRVAGKLLATEEDYQKAIQAEQEPPDAASGVLVRASLDPDHWITAGLTGPIHALIEGRSIFTPIKLDKGVNAAVMLGPDKLLASGYLWEEVRKQLAYKPLVIVQREGRGHAIGFTADPNFRAFMDGLNVLFLNGVFRGPAHARLSPSEQ